MSDRHEAARYNAAGRALEVCWTGSRRVSSDGSTVVTIYPAASGCGRLLPGVSSTLCPKIRPTTRMPCRWRSHVIATDLLELGWPHGGRDGRNNAPTAAVT